MIKIACIIGIVILVASLFSPKKKPQSGGIYGSVFGELGGCLNTLFVLVGIAALVFGFLTL